MRPHSRPLDGRRPHEPAPSPQLAGGCRDHRAIQSNQVGPRRPGSLEWLELENLREAVPDLEGFGLLDAAEKPTRQVGRADMVARLVKHHGTSTAEQHRPCQVPTQARERRVTHHYRLSLSQLEGTARSALVSSHRQTDVHECSNACRTRRKMYSVLASKHAYEVLRTGFYGGTEPEGIRPWCRVARAAPPAAGLVSDRLPGAHQPHSKEMRWVEDGVRVRAPHIWRTFLSRQGPGVGTAPRFPDPHRTSTMRAPW
jgi:hypothetical protein